MELMIDSEKSETCTGRIKDRHTQRQRDWPINKKTNTHRQTYRQTDTHTHRQTGRQTDRQTDRQNDANEEHASIRWPLSE